jgi:hypothetical protein
VVTVVAVMTAVTVSGEVVVVTVVTVVAVMTVMTAVTVSGEVVLW